MDLIYHISILIFQSLEPVKNTLFVLDFLIKYLEIQDGARKMSDMHRKMLLSNNPALRLPPKIPVQQSHHHHGVSSSGTAAAAKRGPKDYSLLPWTNYFDRMRDIELENGDRFRVYIKGNQGPVFLFLHGGGFSGLTWAVLSETIVKKIECQCYGLDIRGHGR